jgi:hypothetical protein
MRCQIFFLLLGYSLKARQSYVTLLCKCFVLTRTKHHLMNIWVP